MIRTCKTVFPRTLRYALHPPLQTLRTTLWAGRVQTATLWLWVRVPVSCFVKELPCGAAPSFVLTPAVHSLSSP